MLWEKKARLEELFLNKMCKVRGEMISGTNKPWPFKRVIEIEISGPPSGWYWAGWLCYEDGTKSISFTRIKEVKIKGAE